MKKKSEVSRAKEMLPQKDAEEKVVERKTSNKPSDHQSTSSAGSDIDNLLETFSGFKIEGKRKPIGEDPPARTEKEPSTGGGGFSDDLLDALSAIDIANTADSKEGNKTVKKKEVNAKNEDNEARDKTRTQAKPLEDPGKKMVECFQVDLGFSLYPHQKEGLDWLWKLHCKNRGGILADDMVSLPARGTERDILQKQANSCIPVDSTTTQCLGARQDYANFSFPLWPLPELCDLSCLGCSSQNAPKALEGRADPVRAG